MTQVHEAVFIRCFHPADQTAAQGLILAGLQEHWGQLDPTKNPDLDDIAATYADGVFLTAWRGGELVGTGALVPEAERIGRVVRMSVAAHLRRQGIGTLILQRLCEHARAAGYRRLVLETTANWRDAIAFYERRGFRPVESRAGDLHFEFDLAG